MGIIKRIFRKTSSKLLASIGAQRNSHQLNGCGGVDHIATGLKHSSSSASSNIGLHQMASARRANRLKRKSRDSGIPEALLIASKNYLPPVQFHHVHGTNAQLNKNKFVARRTQGFCQALVFSNRVILPNERVYIKVLEIAKGWSGTIRFGFTSVDPATLRYQMPKHACPDMTNAGHTWARALADEVVRRNSVIHFSYNTNGYIHYGINNQDCGVFYANVNTTQHLWFIVDIYGQTAAVELIDPRIHNASSELDLSRLGDEENDLYGTGVTMASNRSTMYKSTGAMDSLMMSNFHGGSSAIRNKKKRTRKTGRQAMLAYEPWSQQPNGLLLPSALQFNHTASGAEFLPNLSSILLPSAQQNIYSPMPTAITNRPNQPSVRNESHDYHQIMTNTNELNPVRGANKMSAAAAAPPPPLTTSHTAQSVAETSNHSLMSTSTSSTLNSSSTTSNARSRVIDEQEICQQLNGFQLSDNNGQHQRPASKSPKSTSMSTSIAASNKSVLPVPTARRTLQNSALQTNFRRNLDTGLKDYTKISGPPTGTNLKLSPAALPSKSSSKTSNSNAKLKARHPSVRTQRSTLTHRDNNNNSPPSKDCPICFERPINCVLYQCGHMCTCYECGVKQWRTQSRTCPICRTVIKDVIKTYMS